MQTDLPASLLATAQGQRADQILRSCVHCGFCNATCPTYELLGDELDGPRGRIYLIKNMLEQPDEAANRAAAQTHLDRCLTCRACETTCPSGVAYGELLEIGRATLEQTEPRKLIDSFLRRFLRALVPHPARYAALARVGGVFAGLLPRTLKPLVAKVRPAKLPGSLHQRQVLLLQGCVQRTLTPDVNAALTNLLDRNSISVRFALAEACCGGLSLHLGEEAEALNQIRANIDALWPHLEEVEAVISTASGCGVTIRDYPRLMAADDGFAEKAEALSHKFFDVAEYLSIESLECAPARPACKVAWHAPCTLQHGQKVTGLVEKILQTAGYELVSCEDGHLCCGAAGTYSILQPRLSRQLKTNKLTQLQRNQPDVIATANVGCQTHLAGAADVPVVHWIELLN